MAKSQISKEGKKPAPDRIIAGLTFGFWTTLLTNMYEDNQSVRLIWPALTSHVFQNAPAGLPGQIFARRYFRLKN